MKFNTTYIQNTSLKKTIIDISNAKKKINKFIFKNFDLIELEPPMLLENFDHRIIDEFRTTRPIKFDLGDEGKIAELISNPSNWLRDMINKIELSLGKGLYTHGRFLKRDLVETPSSSVVNDEIIVQIKCSNEGVSDKIKEIALNFYKFICDIANEYENIYKYELKLPKKIDFITTQDLEYENPNETPHDRELAIILEKNAFFLSSPGLKLNSGHIHEKISPEIYDLKNYFELILIDTINNSLIKPFKISVLANGIQLDDQLSLFDLDSLRSNEFYAKLTKEKFKIIEFSINIPKLMMFILKKGHISELQPDIISDESNIINIRHKIERM